MHFSAVGSHASVWIKRVTKRYNITRRSGLLALVCAGGCLLGSASFATTIFVDAKSNIFGYGVTTPQPGGGGGGLVAPRITLTPGTNRTVTFSATGSAGWPNVPTGPDGATLGLAPPVTDIPAVAPVSSYASPVYGELTGLFVEADLNPVTAATPAGISYPNLASIQATTFSPGIRQVFFIGDGLTGTGTGTTQTFNIPDEAAYLVLGITDAFNRDRDAGYYNDNNGGFNVTYNIVPEPSSLALLGLASLLIARRRRG